MQSAPKVISQKVCLVGDFGVGKTSLIRQFVDRQFSDQYLSTVGVKISRKLVAIPDKTQEQLQLIVWDIEGSTRFKAIAPTYLQGAKGAVIVADVTRQSSVENLEDHVQLFRSVCPKSSLIIALNKIDLMENNEREQICQEIFMKFNSLKIPVYTTSAKTGENVDKIFQSLAIRMVMLE
ncbi:MAG: Rab family GTPase [Pseudanabaena sp.]|jgi:small GTP-binding protein